MGLIVLFVLLALYVCLGYIAATVVIHVAKKMQFEERRKFVGIMSVGILLCTGMVSGQRTVTHPGNKWFFGFIYTSFVGGLVVKLGKDNSV